MFGGETMLRGERQKAGSYEVQGVKMNEGAPSVNGEEATG